MSDNNPSNTLVKYQLLFGAYVVLTSAGLYRVHRLPFAGPLKAQRYRGVVGGTSLAAAVVGTGMYYWFDDHSQGGGSGSGGNDNGSSSGSMDNKNEALDQKKVAASQRD